MPPLLRPLTRKFIKRHFQLGSEPLWAWVCAVLDRQDAINELFKCVLRSLLPEQVLNHPVAEEKAEYTGQGKDPPDSVC